MSDTVYLFGAGINRGLAKTQYGSYELKPPLATDFFQQALRLEEISSDPDTHQGHFGTLYAYIERHWKLSFNDLKNVPFNLEECFTLVQQQQLDASRNQNLAEYETLLRVEQQLVRLLRHLLSQFDITTLLRMDYTTTGPPSPNKEAVAFNQLALLIMEESATVLSFNYDLILETALEHNSSVRGWCPGNKLPHGDITYSHYNWNAPLAYGFKFNEVALHQSGVPNYVSGESFYEPPENQLYSPPLLKLHGSLNWAAYTRFRRQWPAPDLVEDPAREGEVLIQYHQTPSRLSDTSWPEYSLMREDWVLEPLIITPVLNKDLTAHPFPTLWSCARQELASCKRLIVGGYSFMPSDFATRRLFLEAFTDNVLDELVVINPNTEVVQLVKNLCHFRKPALVCRDLGEFIASRS